MNRPVVGIFGNGGCGRGIVPVARAAYPEADIVFVVDSPNAGFCNGTPVLDFAAFAALEEERTIAVAVAASRVRADIVARCEAAGIAFAEVRAPGSVWMDDVSVGVGGLFSPFTTVTSNVRIGRHFHCNLYGYVEHDCVIGDFVTFAPAVRCNGNVTIGDFAYIGSNAVIRQGVSIGAGATVGMGAVVAKDVSAGATVVGNPARPIAS